MDGPGHSRLKTRLKVRYSSFIASVQICWVVPCCVKQCLTLSVDVPVPACQREDDTSQ